jgi:uncharacterized protein HemY
LLDEKTQAKVDDALVEMVEEEFGEKEKEIGKAKKMTNLRLMVLIYKTEEPPRN